LGVWSPNLKAAALFLITGAIIETELDGTKSAQHGSKG